MWVEGLVVDPPVYWGMVRVPDTTLLLTMFLPITESGPSHHFKRKGEKSLQFDFSNFLLGRWGRSGSRDH